MDKPAPFKAKAVLFVMMALTCSFALAGAAYLDMEFKLSIHAFSIAVKLALMLTAAAYAALRGVPMNAAGSRFFSMWLPVALIPFVLTGLNTLRMPNRMPAATEWIEMLLSVFTTAAWEEMFYRYVARTLFERDGRYTPGAVVLLTLTFGSAHLINMFFYAPAAVLLQTLNACVFGLFLLALYRHTGSLRLVIASHFFNNLIATFFDFFADTPYLIQSAAPFILLIVAEAAVGLFILIRYGYVARDNGERASAI